MKRTAYLVLALLLASLVTYGYFLSESKPKIVTSPIANVNGQTVAQNANVSPNTNVPANSNAPSQAGTPAEQAQPTETKIAEPVPDQYFPPPSINLSGGKLGTQEVPFTDSIGDIHQVYFHLPSYTLYMAVTEPDGLRSIWQLKEHRKPERVFAATAGKGDIAIFGDSRGVMYVQYDNPCKMYRTDDAFKTWHLVHEQPCMFWSMADDGKGNVYATLHDWNTAVLYRSQDDGFTWEAWKDFQKLFPDYAVPYAAGDDRFKLRHLHDVIYDPQSDRLIVGTGDVARYAYESADGGATWKQIWDEGFTSHAVMSGGDRYLLGPDQLHSHGIALYDVAKGTVTQVWNPQPYNYAGYVYSMIDVDGVYYAATHTEANEVASIVPKFGIIVSPNGTDWYRFLEWGPLTNNARTDIWMTSAPGIVYASVNGSLYAFRPIDKAWFADQVPFGAK